MLMGPGLGHHLKTEGAIPDVLLGREGWDTE